MNQRHDGIEVHAASNRAADPFAVAGGPALRDLPLQRRTHPELEQELEEPETPGESVGTENLCLKK